MNLLRIAARVSAVESVALPESWRMITEEQIQGVLALCPPGTKVYGSYSTGTANRGSDLDLKLPKDVGDGKLARLMVEVTGKFDLYLGAVNISMPCSQHEGCSVVAHMSAQHVVPPLIEHMLGGLQDPEDLPEDVREMRQYRKDYFKAFLEELETDAELLPDAVQRRQIDKFLAGRPAEEVLSEYKPLLPEKEFEAMVREVEAMSD